MKNRLSVRYFPVSDSCLKLPVLSNKNQKAPWFARAFGW